ncbi:hypothetical protein GCM10007863_34950 [Dyella mobilis]|nr:hypothetical protein GCM10007863_34950 [Dyella mobilis]
MQYRQLRVVPANTPHDWVSDGMVTTKADQWTIQLHYLSYRVLDEIPRVGLFIEDDIGAIHQSAWRTEVYARFAP